MWLRPVLDDGALSNLLVRSRAPLARSPALRARDRAGRATRNSRERSPPLSACLTSVRAQSTQVTAQRRAARPICRLFYGNFSRGARARASSSRVASRIRKVASTASAAPSTHGAFCVARLGLERNKAHSPSSSASMSGSRSSGSSSSSPPPLPLRDCDLGRMLARRFAAEVSCTSAHCRMAPRVFARPL